MTNLAAGDTSVGSTPTWSVTWATKSADVGDDPGYAQSTVGYKFGNSSIGVSYYGGSNQGNSGSTSTAIGIGAAHVLPKAAVDLYVSAQNYSVDDAAITSFDIGSRVGL